MTAIKLVIFDCDGVLVDSEYLSSKVKAELLTDAGFATTGEELSERYNGMTFEDTLIAIEKQIDIPLSANLLDKAHSEFVRRIDSELLAIDGVRDLVNSLDLPYCICSNSISENIKKMLQATGLYDLFEGKIFSAPETGSKKPKPAPDVFLSAAKSFNIAPENTVVIEDSVPGATAAVAAGMRVIGFTGGTHVYPGLADALTDVGAATVVNRHKDIKAVITAMESWQDVL